MKRRRIRDFEARSARYDYFDDLRLNLTRDEGIGVRDEMSTIIAVRNNPEENEETIYRLMHVAVAAGISDNGTIIPSRLVQLKSIILGVHHFNNGNTAVVQDLNTITAQEGGEKCNLKITVDFYDTQRIPVLGSELLVQQILPRKFPFMPTALIGAGRSAVSLPLAVVSAVERLPQVSYSSTSTDLDDRGSFDSFGRVIPSDQGSAEAAIDFFRQVMGTTHLGIICVNDPYGSAYRRALEDAARSAGIRMRSFVFQYDDDILSPSNSEGSLAKAIDGLLSTGFRHFMGVMFPQHFEILVEIGGPRGLLGPGKFWLFGDGITASEVGRMNYPAGSSLAGALQGFGIIGVGPSTSDKSHDRFVRSLRAVDDDRDFGEYYESKSPPVEDSVKFDASHRVAEVPAFAALAYDSVMALGIAGCRCESQLFSGDELFAQFLQSNFTGASGNVVVDASTGSRLYNSSTFVISNSRLVQSDEAGFVTAEFVPGFEYRRQGSGVARWIGAAAVGFNFSDFSSTPPAPLPPVQPKDLHNRRKFAVITSISSVIMLAAIGFAIWTWRYRESRVVKASQPGFLLAICVGVFFLAFAAISRGAESPPQGFDWANFSCMGTIWFFGFGFSLVFSALFAKLWRINKILGMENRFRRIVVGPRDVILPVIVVVLGNLGVTLIWQILDPMKYTLTLDDSGSVDKFGRPVDVLESCVSDGGNEFVFLAIIFILNGGALVAANVQAYRARRITTEFSESLYIAIANSIILQGTVIAFPTLFIDDDHTTKNISQATLMLLTASSTLFLIFLPKVGFWLERKKRLKEKEERRKQRVEKADTVDVGGEKMSVVEESDEEEEESESIEDLPTSRNTEGLQVVALAKITASFRSRGRLTSSISLSRFRRDRPRAPRSDAHRSSTRSSRSTPGFIERASRETQNRLRGSANVRKSLGASGFTGSRRERRSGFHTLRQSSLSAPSMFQTSLDHDSNRVGEEFIVEEEFQVPDESLLSMTSGGTMRAGDGMRSSAVRFCGIEGDLEDDSRGIESPSKDADGEGRANGDEVEKTEGEPCIVLVEAPSKENHDQENDDSTHETGSLTTPSATHQTESPRDSNNRSQEPDHADPHDNQVDSSAETQREENTECEGGTIEDNSDGVRSAESSHRGETFSDTDKDSTAGLARDSVGLVEENADQDNEVPAERIE